jgi:uncharacterized Zn ribbon protein
MKLKKLLLITLLTLLNNVFAKSNIDAIQLNNTHNQNSIDSNNNLLQRENHVIFYRDIKYSGMQKKVGAGNFGSGTLGFLAETISSIHIPSGYSVKVNDKRGHTHTFTTSVSNLAQYGWDNKISSGFIEVNYNGGGSGGNLPPQGEKAIFYKDMKFTGMAKAFANGGFSPESLGFLKSNITSIYIPSGHSVKVYDNRGNNHTFTTSVSDLSKYGWNDKITTGIVSGDNAGGTLPPQGNKAIFYKDMKFTGMAKAFANGSFSPESLGFLKSNITSIYIPSGHSVKVYDDRGNNHTFTTSVSDLSQYGWNDKITTGVVSGSNTGGTLPPQGNRVVFYRDLKYTGISKEFNQGNLGTGSLGILTNNISSIYIPQGWSVKVNDQNGRTHTFTKSVSNLMQLGWDNRIHSGFISTDNGGQHGGNTGKVVLFNDADYLGNRTPCGEGKIKYLGNTADNNISSIQLSPGYGIKVYDQTNLTGRSQTFTRSVRNLTLYGWNNKISSVHVYRL